MSSAIKLTGEIVQEGPEFVVKVDIRFPKMDQATDFCKWLNEAIVEHVESKGGTMKRESPLIIPS